MVTKSKSQVEGGGGGDQVPSGGWGGDQVPGGGWGMVTKSRGRGGGTM